MGFMRLRSHIMSLAIAALVGVIALFAEALPAVAAKRDCRTSGRTLVANAKVRVFYRVVDDGDGRLYYACDVRHRRRRSLGTYSGIEGGGVSPTIAIVGRSVAFEDVSCDRDATCDGSAYLLDVVTNQEKVIDRMSGAQPATDLTVSSAHAVYWIQPTAGGYAVIRGHALEPPQVLEEGPGVQPRSLAVAGRAVYWTSSGQPRAFTD
jgi:hypothetical protein